MKKLISVLLTIAIVFSCFAIFAAGASASDTGSAFGFIAKISAFIKKLTDAIKLYSPASDTLPPAETAVVTEPLVGESDNSLGFGHFNVRDAA